MIPSCWNRGPSLGPHVDPSRRPRIPWTTAGRRPAHLPPRVLAEPTHAHDPPDRLHRHPRRPISPGPWGGSRSPPWPCSTSNCTGEAAVEAARAPPIRCCSRRSDGQLLGDRGLHARQQHPAAAGRRQAASAAGSTSSRRASRTLSRGSFAGRAQELLALVADHPHGLAGTFPGSPHAFTAMLAQRHEGQVRWRTWHAYPQEGRSGRHPYAGGGARPYRRTVLAPLQGPPAVRCADDAVYG